jgi:streptogramin lyase
MNPFVFLSRRLARPRTSPRPPQSRLALESLEDRRLLSGFSYFNLRPPFKFVAGLTAGPDGNMWFTEYANDAIGRMSTDGVNYGEFYLSNGSAPNLITTGPDGNIWFTEYNSNKIGRMTPDGLNLQEWSLPDGEIHPNDITAGPDGNVWFTEDGSAMVGRITPAGVMTTWTTQSVYGRGMAAGSDGNVWFGMAENTDLGRITPAGDIQYFNLFAADVDPTMMTTDSNGYLWIATGDHGSVLKIDVNATSPTIVGEYQIANHCIGITAVPGGDIWVGTLESTSIYSVSMSTGVVTEYPIDYPHSNYFNVAAGPDGNIWFNDTANNALGRYNLQSYVANGGGNLGAPLAVAAGQLTTNPVPAQNSSFIASRDSASAGVAMPTETGSRQAVDAVFSGAASDQGVVLSFEAGTSQSAMESAFLNGDLGAMPVLVDSLGT